MSLNLCTWAWSVQGISYQAKFALLALADCCNHDRQANCCWPSIPWLCERTLMPKRSLLRAFEELETAHLISRTNGGGRYTTIYRLVGPTGTEGEAGAVPVEPMVPIADPSESPVGPAAETVQGLSDPPAVPDRHRSRATQARQQCLPGTVAVPTRHGSSAPQALHQCHPGTAAVPDGHGTGAPQAPQQCLPGTRNQEENQEGNQEAEGGRERGAGPTLSAPQSLAWEPVATALRPELDAPAVFAKFSAYYGDQQRTAADWEKLWRLWLLRERETHPGRRTPGPQSASRELGGFVKPAYRQDLMADYEVSDGD